MKNNFISIIFVLSALSFVPAAVTAQSPVNNILLGKQDRAALQQPPFADWFNTNYHSYVVDSFTCNYIRPLLHDKQITIFLGTWCGDSRREVPRFLKMLDCCEFPMNQLTLIMVGNSDSLYKKSPQHEEAGRNIMRVPTIIIEQKSAEVGRIIEFPVTSLEKDLLSILRKDNYLPNYHQMKADGR